MLQNDKGFILMETLIGMTISMFSVVLILGVLGYMSSSFYKGVEAHKSRAQRYELLEYSIRERGFEIEYNRD